MAIRSDYFRNYRRLKRTGTKKTTQCEAMIWSINNTLVRCCLKAAKNNKGPSICSPTRHTTTQVRTLKLSKNEACARGLMGGDIVEVKRSTIPGAGKGIFAKLPLLPGDYITTYDGTYFKNLHNVPLARMDRVYKISEFRYVVGYLEPRERRGLASFINTLEKETKAKNSNITKQYNARLVAHRGRVYLKAITKVNAGEELYAPYGSMRVKNKVEL